MYFYKNILLDMKKLFLAITSICISALTVNAQNFEGTLKYTISMSGIDATQKAMLPTGYTITIKGVNSKFVTEGGMMGSMLGDIISRGDEKVTYLVNHTTKVANKLKNEENKNEGKKPDVKVTKENSTAKILGYDCQKYKVTSKDESGAEQIIYLWAAKDLQLGGSHNSSSPVGGVGQFVFDGVEGFPLKMEITNKMQGTEIKTVLTATKIDLSKVDESAVSVPKDYKIEEGLPELLKMMQQMK